MAADPIFRSHSAAGPIAGYPVHPSPTRLAAAGLDHVGFGDTRRLPSVAGRQTHLGVWTSTIKAPPDVMVATRNINRYPVARQNQGMPEFNPVARCTTDAKRPGTHTFPVVRGERRVDSPFAANHRDTGAARSEERRVGKECRSRWSRCH